MTGPDPDHARRPPVAPPDAPPVAPPVDPPVHPPVDLDVPLTNPELVAALQRDQAAGTGFLGPDTLQLLRNAVYLQAMVMTHPDGGPAVIDGTLRKGSRLSLFGLADNEDRPVMAVFTDWESLRAGCGEGWSGRVVPAAEVLEWGSAENSGGIVINVKGPVVTQPLTALQIRGLLDEGV